MKRIFLSTLLLIALSQIVLAQASHRVVEKDDEAYFSRLNAGVGIGIDYGGIVGARLSFLPAKPVFLFAGLGYNLQTAGYNVGAGVRLAPNRNFCPYLIGMYGYNGVIVVENNKDYSKTYYGPSAGVGAEIHSRTNNNFLNVELLAPFRPSSFNDDMDALENIGVEFKNKPLPIAFSLGYHVSF